MTNKLKHRFRYRYAYLLALREFTVVFFFSCVADEFFFGALASIKILLHRRVPLLNIFMRCNVRSG